MDSAMSIPHPTVRQIAISRIEVGVTVIVAVIIRIGTGKEGCAEKSSVVKAIGKESVIETIDSGAKRATEGGMGTHHRRPDGSTAEGRVGSHHRRRGGCTPERRADATEASSVKSAEPTVESTSASVESTASVEAPSTASVEAPSTAPVEAPSTAKSCSPGRRERGGRQAERQGDDSNQIASHGTTFQ
jgi:hypothetical protein